jgi:large subunit ribosomal protein L9
MKKTVKLLLTETVDNLGIVGDVVTVRAGYARNYLLPRSMATEPSEELVAQLATKRADAQKFLAEQRKHREAMLQKMIGFSASVARSCNDQGILYGAVTQQDLSDLFAKHGFTVKPREIRIPQVIKRVGDYDVHIKLDSDLQTDIKLHVAADRVIHEDDEREEMDFDNEGNLIEKPKGEKRGRGQGAEKPAEAAEAPVAEEAPKAKPRKEGKKDFNPDEVGIEEAPKMGKARAKKS